MLHTLRVLRPRLAAILLSSGILAPAPVAAAASKPIELVPLLGVRGGEDLAANVPGQPAATAGASASFGLEVDVFVRPDAWFEAFIDHQSLSFSADPSTFGTSHFDMAVDYLQFGGGYEPKDGRVRPFVSATLGVTRYGTSTGDVQTATAFSGSLGGGFKVPAGKRLSLRFEVLGYATGSGASATMSCGTNCSIEYGGNGWYQLAARVGLGIRL